MGENRIRLLRADEIECRVSMINGNGLGLLLFKDARVDQRILDEAFTPFGWRRTHQSIRRRKEGKDDGKVSFVS